MPNPELAGPAASRPAAGLGATAARVPQWWRRLRNPLWVATTYVACWIGLDAVSQLFQARQDVSLWYPPPALDFVLLLVFGLRYIPLLLVTDALHALLITAPQLSWPSAALGDVITVVVYGGAAAVLLRRVQIDPRLPTQRDAVWFIAVACIGAPLLVAVVEIVQYSAAGMLRWADLPLNVAGFWSGTATGVAMLAPVLLVASRRIPRLWPGRTALPSSGPGLGQHRHRLELIGQALLLLAAVVVGYGTGNGGSLDFTYLAYIPLIWIAVRGGLPRTTAALLVANVVAVAVAGPRVQSDPIALQLGLVSLTLAGLSLGALVAQRRADTERAEYAALHDPLTGLANSVLLTDRLSDARERSVRHPRTRFAVLFADLDRFKQVNDSLGHEAGDQLLLSVAHRLRDCLKPNDLAARLGGDEFAVLLDNIADVTDAEEVAMRILGALDPPYRLADREVPVTACIGIAVNTPGVSQTPTEMLSDADTALQRAKESGPGIYQLFSQPMHQQILDALALRSALHHAVRGDEITVVYQPIVTLPERQTITMEALARWNSSTIGQVPPGRFIPIAEQTGMIRPLGRQILTIACAEASSWQTVHAPALRIAVNVSPTQLADPAFPTEVQEILQAAGMPAGQLELEVTETIALQPTRTTRIALQQLAAAGVRIVIDDFGAGYSSFAALRDFHLHGLKIDESFTSRLPADADTADIIEAILTMAGHLHLDVTAEGVETESQASALYALGCRQAQGYLLGRPLPAAEIASFRPTRL